MDRAGPRSARSCQTVQRCHGGAAISLFHPSAGEILGVLGPNGSGKSTIVKMITGLLDPSHGAVLFHGERIDADSPVSNRAWAMYPEQPDLYGFLTGWEYLDLVATLRGLDRRRFREKATAMLQGFTLYGSRDGLISSYSKGMRQRIVLISALMHDPELLVLDEPFSGLDITSALVLRRVIARLAGNGKAVLFSSPVLEQVDRLCTHLTVLKDGAVVGPESMQEMHAGFGGVGLGAGLHAVDGAGGCGRDCDRILLLPWARRPVRRWSRRPFGRLVAPLSREDGPRRAGRRVLGAGTGRGASARDCWRPPARLHVAA